MKCSDLLLALSIVLTATAAIASEPFTRISVALAPNASAEVSLPGSEAVVVGFEFTPELAERIGPDICPPDPAFDEDMMICGQISQIGPDGVPLGQKLLGGAYPGLTTYYPVDGQTRITLTSRATQVLTFTLVYQQ